MTKSLEVRVDQWVLSQVLDNELTFYQENDVPESISTVLSGASKTGKGHGTPDFIIVPKTHRDIIVVIENKWGHSNLEFQTATGNVQESQKAISEGAVNGALHYAKHLIRDRNINEVIYIGVAGEGGMMNDVEIRNKVYYMFDAEEEPKLVGENVESFAFLKEDNFEEYYHEISLSDREKQRLLTESYQDLQRTSKELNVLFNNNAILVDQRAVYVSGMMLAMECGLKPEDLVGREPRSNSSDGKIIYRAIEDYITKRDIPREKVRLMMDTFQGIRMDRDRDVVRESKIKRTGKNKGLYEEPVSVNKELFLFIYEHVYVTISKKEHLDVLGELYSSFLKYALGDGKDNGIVLTPVYVTRLMNQIIGLDKDSRLLDSCTGSGGFLVTGMSMMLEDNADYHGRLGLGKKELLESSADIKENHLMGIEFDGKMFTLAATNMILRGDGSSQILKGDAFDKLSSKEVKEFNATHGILNPPFNYPENGQPFTLHTLDALAENGKLAVIIQESTGSGQSIKTNKEILSRHTLVASIKMPIDLFEPSAGVASTIYIFDAHVPHDYRRDVRFIDFSDDGYKRTGRGLREVDNPEQKYMEILEVVNYGEEYEHIPFVDAKITDAGNDWNYASHEVTDTVPTEEDFLKTVGDFMQYELKMLMEEVE